MHYVYIIKCKDDTLYTGWTTDLEKRMVAHNLGEGAKYTRGRAPVDLKYYEEFTDKSEALRREIAIKKMTKTRKEELIQRDSIEE